MENELMVGSLTLSRSPKCAYDSLIFQIDKSLMMVMVLYSCIEMVAHRISTYVPKVTYSARSFVSLPLITRV
jgi:hypothetical protein